MGSRTSARRDFEDTRSLRVFVALVFRGLEFSAYGLEDTTCWPFLSDGPAGEQLLHSSESRSPNPGLHQGVGFGIASG